MSTALFKSQSPPFSFLSSQTHTYLRGSSDGGLRCDGKFSTQLSHKTRRYKQGRKKKGDEERNGKLKKDEREEKKKSYGGQRLLFTRPPQFWDSRLTCFFFLVSVALWRVLLYIVFFFFFLLIRKLVLLFSLSVRSTARFTSFADLLELFFNSVSPFFFFLFLLFFVICLYRSITL